MKICRQDGLNRLNRFLQISERIIMYELQSYPYGNIAQKNPQTSKSADFLMHSS